MSKRALYLDRSVGETRGVLVIDGRPERLLIERETDPTSQKLGARSTARVVRMESGLNMAFIQMADGPDGVLPLNGEAAGLAQGLSIEVEVTAEARLDKDGSAKGVVVRLLQEGSGPPRMLTPAPPLDVRLAALAPNLPIIEGPRAREAADIAQDAALAVTNPLPGGGTISIQPTRALIAVDVDMGSRASGSGADAKRAARQTNLAAIAETARLLRLKSLGGLVVIDLVGQGHDGPLLAEAARTAFAPEGLTVGIGPISRFGLFELSVPRGSTPLADRLLDETGQASWLTVALTVLRAIEREAAANPGSRISAFCDVEAAEAAKPYMGGLANQIGHRFQLEARAGMGRGFEVIAR